MSPPDPTHSVRWFDDCCKDDTAAVGGKCASLGELLCAGLRVPPGFAVTTHAYHEFLVRCGLKDPICKVLRAIDRGAALEEVGNQARTMIREAGIPDHLAADVRNAYRELGRRCGVDDLPVAVRSSATLEDLADASFAGQQDTYLWVRGADQVVEKVAACWASLFSDRVIAYREEKGFTHENVRISVGVQKMVRARSSGVLFTLNPVNGDRSKVAINAAWGFGEGVVSGELTPDDFLVDKVTGDVVRRRVAAKPFAYRVRHDGQGVALAAVPEAERDLPSLTEEEILELTRLARGIERHYGRAMDVEWAVDEEQGFPDSLLILQARPETVWAQKKGPSQAAGRSKSALESILGNLLTGVAVDFKKS